MKKLESCAVWYQIYWWLIFMKASLSDFTDNLSEKFVQKSAMNVEMEAKIMEILIKKRWR